MKPPESLTKGKDIFQGLVRNLGPDWFSSTNYTQLMPSQTTFQLIGKRTDQIYSKYFQEPFFL